MQSSSPRFFSSKHFPVQETLTVRPNTVIFLLGTRSCLILGFDLSPVHIPFFSSYWGMSATLHLHWQSCTGVVVYDRVARCWARSCAAVTDVPSFWARFHRLKMLSKAWWLQPISQPIPCLFDDRPFWKGLSMVLVELRRSTRARLVVQDEVVILDLRELLSTCRTRQRPYTSQMSSRSQLSCRERRAFSNDYIMYTEVLWYAEHEYSNHSPRIIDCWFLSIFSFLFKGQVRTCLMGVFFCVERQYGKHLWREKVKMGCLGFFLRGKHEHFGRVSHVIMEWLDVTTHPN